MLADRVLALRRANIYERQTYRHIVGMPLLTGQDAEATTAETPFMVVRTMRDGRMDLFVAGRYRDRLRDQDGTLRFAQRIVICELIAFRYAGGDPAVMKFRNGDEKAADLVNSQSNDR